MVDMDYQTREAVSARLERAGVAMMDAKRACIDKSRKEVRTFFLNVCEKKGWTFALMVQYFQVPLLNIL